MSQTVTQTMSYRSEDPAGPSGSLAATLSDSAAFGAVPQMSTLHETALGKARAEVIVSGANRHKYFRRPIIPFMQAQPPEVIFAAQQGEAAALALPAEPEPEPLSKDMACQSDYRESDTQTDPYTPDYVLPAGAEPD